MLYVSLPLHGEKVSIGSRSPASINLWPAISLCGVVLLWGAPALLLSRYQPDQLLDALTHLSLKPTGGELLTLSFVLIYIMLMGFMLSMATRLPRRKASRVLLRLVVAPLLILSLVSTFIAAVSLFFGVMIMCFPSLM